MLNVGALREGYVLDHIKAGKAMTIYHDLKLDKLDCTVAIIKNARSNKMGKKDIIKVECPVENLDLDILGFIDHNITVNVIKDEKIVAKKELKLPNQVVNVIKCKNPRCITSIEQGLDQIFVLALTLLPALRVLVIDLVLCVYFALIVHVALEYVSPELYALAPIAIELIIITAAPIAAILLTIFFILNVFS